MATVETITAKMQVGLRHLDLFDRSMKNCDPIEVNGDVWRVTEVAVSAGCVDVTLARDVELAAPDTTWMNS
jgi:hypothetical protein